MGFFSASDFFSTQDEEAKNKPDVPNTPAASSQAINESAKPDKAAFIKSIYGQESAEGKADTSTKNYAGAIGPMQVTEETFNGMKANGQIPADYDINNPAHTKAAGETLATSLYDKYGGDVRKAAAAYYSGPKAVGADGTIKDYRDPKNPKAPSTLEYVDQVTGRIKKSTPVSPAPAGTSSGPKKWADVQASAGFQRLSADEQEAARNQYFADVVAPQVPDADIQHVREMFDNSTVHSLGDKAKDLALSLGAGSGGLIKGIGTAYGLITGDMDNFVRQAGEDAQRDYGDMQSPTLRGKEAVRREDIDKADGQLSKAWTAIKSTTVDPTLLANFVTEQLPNLVPGAAAGRVVGAGAKAAELSAAAAGTAATAGAVGTGAALQAADIGGDTYDDVVTALVKKGVPRAVAVAQALDLSRKAAAAAGTTSVLANLIPGGSTIERAIVGAGGKGVAKTALGGAVKGGIGEAASEAIEESTGKIANNVAVQQVDPTRQTFEGAGEAGGLGALGALATGGTIGAVEAKVHSMREHAAELRGEKPAGAPNDVNAEQPMQPGAPGAPSQIGEPVQKANWELVDGQPAPNAAPQLADGTLRLAAPEQQPALPGPQQPIATAPVSEDGSTTPIAPEPAITSESAGVVKEPADPVKTNEPPPPETPHGRAAQAVVDAFTSAYKGAQKLSVKVFDSASELGKDWVVSPGEGWYNRKTGEVGIDAASFVRADGTVNTERINQVLAHEVIGHHGIESLVRGREFDQLVDDVHRLAMSKDGLATAGKDSNGHVVVGDKDYATIDAVKNLYGGNRTLQAMEVIARMAETGVKPGLVDRLLNVLRAALRKSGINLKLTKAELRGIVDAARRHVERGENSTLSGEEADALSAKQGADTAHSFNPEDEAAADRAAARMANPEMYAENDGKEKKGFDDSKLSKEDKLAIQDELAGKQLAESGAVDPQRLGREPTEAEMKPHGLSPENAYDDLQYKANPEDKDLDLAQHGGRAFRIRTSDIPKGGKTERVFRAVPGVADTNNGSALYLSGAKSRAAAERYNKVQAVAENLRRRGFDLAKAVTKKQAADVLKTWRLISAYPEAFRYGLTDKKRAPTNTTGRIGSIIKELGIDRDYNVTVTPSKGRGTSDGGAPTDSRGGTMFRVELEDKSKTIKGNDGKERPVYGYGEIEYVNAERGHPAEIRLHSTGMNADSGIGTPFYQIGASVADELGVQVKADPAGLTGINSYRRTEQMLSAALRAGTAGTMQPGDAQRIFGWNPKAKTSAAKDENLVRLALASARNNVETLPALKDMTFDLATGDFKDAAGRVVSPEVVGALKTPEARTFGLSYSSMARAALTFEALSGKVPTVDNIKSPVVYSKKVGERVATEKEPSLIDRFADIFAGWEIDTGHPANETTQQHAERLAREHPPLPEFREARTRNEPEESQQSMRRRMAEEQAATIDAPDWGIDNSERPARETAALQKSITPSDTVAQGERQFGPMRGGDKDIYTSVPRAARRRVAEAWKGIFSLPGALKYGKVKEGSRSIDEIVRDMGLDKYGVVIRRTGANPSGGPQSFSMQFTKDAKGRYIDQYGDAQLVGTDTRGQPLKEPYYVLHTTGFDRGGLGSAFYAAMSEYAAKNNIKIEPDSVLTHINEHRRTENMLSGQVRTGKTPINQHEDQQGIRGLNRNASTPEQHERNLVRTALKALENAQAVFPTMDSLRYDVQTGQFQEEDGSSAETRVKAMLDRDQNSRARMFGAGRSTLTRAVLTNMAVNGWTTGKPTRAAENILYSKKVGERVEQFAKDAQARKEKTAFTEIAPGAPHPAMEMLGLGRNQRVLLDADHVRHILNTHPDITPAMIGSVPELLKNPRAVFTSKPGDRVTVIVNQRDDQGRPLMIALGKDKASNGPNAAPLRITSMRTLFNADDSLKLIADVAEMKTGAVWLPSEEVSRVGDITARVNSGQAANLSASSQPNLVPHISASADARGGSSTRDAISVLSDAALVNFLKGKQNWADEKVSVPVPPFRQRAGINFSKAVGQGVKVAGSDYSSGPIDALFKHAGGKAFARYITQPLFDRVTRLAGRVVPEKVKQGVISDYGLSEPYLDARFDRDVNVNKTLREAQNVLAGIAGMSAEQSKVAYHWMQEKPDTAAEAAMLAQLSESDQAVVKQMKSLVDKLGAEAVKVGLLNEETYKANRMAYLHRSYAKHELNTPGATQRMKEAASIRAENMKMRGIKDETSNDNLIRHADEVKVGDKMIRLESRSPATAAEQAKGLSGDRLRGVRYVPVGVDIPKEYASWKNDGEWDVMSLGPKKAVLRRQLTKAERSALGEIEEVRFAFAKTALNAVRDIENARFLNWVKEQHGVDPDTVTPENMKPTSENFWTLMTYGKDDMVTVPKTLVPGTKVHRYGALAGVAVPGAVWNDVRNSMSLPDGDVAKIINSMTKVWKVSKTSLSPAVHMNNVMSNFIMADMADVGGHDVAKALIVLARAKAGNPEAAKLVQQYDDSGADTGSFAAIEINETHVKKLLDTLQGDTALSQLSMAQIVNLALHGRVKDAGTALAGKKAVKAAAAPFKKMMDIYAAEDGVFRLAKYMKELENGKSDRDAAKAAKAAFLDYNINAPWIQTARRSGLPFIAFSYRAYPLIAQTVRDKPWKAAKYAAAFTALNALAYAALGASGDEKKERALLPDEMQGKMLGVFPRMVRMPWNTDSPVFLDARRWVPGGDMFDTTGSKAGVPVPSWLSVGGPLAAAVEFFANRSLFTGKDVTDKNDTTAQSIAKIADWQFKFWSPNIPLPGPGHLIPGLEPGQLQTYSWQGVLDATKGKTDPFGREMTVGQSMLNSMGVKVKSYPEDVAKQRVNYEFQDAKSGVDRTLKAAGRQLKQRGIDQEEFDRIKTREQEKLQRAGAKAKAALSGAEAETP